MKGTNLGRRQVLTAGAVLAAATLTPRALFAQPAARRTPLPPRGEFVVRGATVLTMDPAVPDLAAGDIHVRDGAIVAVARRVEAPGAQVVDGAGMICIPGFI